MRKEALWAVSNIFTYGSTSQIQRLVEMEGMDAMCEVLESQDTRMLFAALDAIESLLRDGAKNGKPYKLLMDVNDGITKIEKLQQHINDEVYEKVLKIIDEFFGVEDDEDENLAPATDGNSFAFGIPSNLGLLSRR